MFASKLEILEGNADQQGAHCVDGGINFALYSKSANKVELCLFDPEGREQVASLPLPAKTGDVWHGFVPGLKEGQVYAYRVDGSGADGKLLLDPFTQEHAGKFTWTDKHLPYVLGHPEQQDTRDNAAEMIKGRVVGPGKIHPSPRLGPVTTKDVIYEAHIRGLTMELPGIPEEDRGTCKGFASDAVINHLKELGVTAVEFLPLQCSLAVDIPPGGGNRDFWRYNPINYFAISPDYLKTGEISEFQEMVDKLHANGIKVVMDVVYNHTMETGNLGPAFSMRGVDRDTYYRDYNISGVGNMLEVDNPQTQELVAGSVEYFETMGVDDFRYDLAPALGWRYGHGYTASHPLLARLGDGIMEPWAPTDNGYQFSNFGPGQKEWNGPYRNTMRRFWLGEDNLLKDFANRLSGSRNRSLENGPDDGLGKKSEKTTSINFITAHDGFTLRDLVSYQHKHNEANGNNNSDGDDHNNSSNYGVEGPTDDEHVNALRWKQQRNLFTTLMLSNGTPMVLAGDEVGNSQQGNNNTYNQDNERGWVNFKDLGTEEKNFKDFARYAISVRKAFPVLTQEKFLGTPTPETPPGKQEVEWLRPDGQSMTPENWNAGFAKTLTVVFDNSAVPQNGAAVREDRKLCALFNAYSGNVPCVLPDPGEGMGWSRVLDTSNTKLRAGMDETVYAPGTKFSAKGQSVTVFVQAPL